MAIEHAASRAGTIGASACLVAARMWSTHHGRSVFVESSVEDSFTTLSPYRLSPEPLDLKCWLTINPSRPTRRYPEPLILSTRLKEETVARPLSIAAVLMLVASLATVVHTRDMAPTSILGATPVGTPQLTALERQYEGWPANQLARGHAAPFAFPPSQAFGDDWVVFSVTASTRKSEDITTYTGTYSSGFGSFILAAVTPYYGRLANGLSATTFAEDQFDYYRSHLRPITPEMGFDRPSSLALNRTALPSGCESADRMEGLDYLTGQQVGITSCQSDDIDAVLVVTVVGELNYFPEFGEELNALQFSERSDFVVSNVVQTISDTGGIREPSGTPIA